MPAQERGHDQGDQAEDQVGLAEMASLEPRGPLDLADQERRRHADEHQYAEDVDEEEEPALVPEPRDRPVAVDGAEERHHDRREEDDEAPEDQRVDDPRDEALEELALAEHDRRLGADAPTEVAAPVGRLAHPDEPVEEVRALGEEAACDRDQEAQRDADSAVLMFPGGRRQPDTSARVRLIAAVSAGTISCMSPITA